ncbi:MAG: hypothetical protein M3Z23_12985 [Acidobacteriota bacterium]|nr:hypothetical protein [Acidobacteriota bacterium]
MHFRRFAAYLLGAWLAGCLLMDMVAIQNFRSVDRLLAEPDLGIATQLRAMGHDNARSFLRHHVAEQNRWYFEQWERIQFGIALALFLVLLFGTPPNKYSFMLCAGMVFLVAVERFVLTPEITRLGRILDFIPPLLPSRERDRFWTFHGAYSAIELLKSGLGLLLTGTLLIRGRRDRGRFARQVDRIDRTIDQTKAGGINR